MKAAGILIRTKSEGQVLFLKRGPGGDYPGFWCFPGGRQEEGEALEETARRECKEEIGSVKQAKLTYLCRNISFSEPAATPPEPAVGGAGVAPLAPASPSPNEVDFTTFMQIVDDKFEVVKDGEHVGYAWAPAGQPPEPLHPGCKIALDVLKADELDIANMIADGQITSPHRYKNITFFAMRVTGTELAFRREKTDGKGKVLRQAEWAWREPELYLTQRFCDRCAGLPVVYYHPEKKAMLDSDEFKERVIGAIMFAYIKENEVWCVARIYDDDAITIMLEEQMSTSPGVILAPGESQKHELDDGTVLLIEGKPSLLDHLAVCKLGVWDKGGEAAGVAIHDSTEERKDMSDKTEEKEELKHDANSEKLDAIMDAVKGMKADSEKRHDEMSKRLDAMEARCDAIEKDSKKDGDGDEDEDDKKEDKKDARKDAKKDEGDEGTGEEEGKAREMKADKKDAKKDEKEEEEEEEKHDSTSVEELRKQVAEMRAKMPVHQSDEEYSALIAEQARADDVYQAFGKNAPRPLLGETPSGYRKRVASELKSYSQAWKNIDITRFDDNALSVAYDQIRHDAVAAANRPVDLPEGQEIATQRRDKTGHLVTTFRRRNSFVRDLSQTSRACTKIDTNPGRSA